MKKKWSGVARRFLNLVLGLALVSVSLAPNFLNASALTASDFPVDYSGALDRCNSFQLATTSSDYTVSTPVVYPQDTKLQVQTLDVRSLLTTNPGSGGHENGKDLCIVAERVIVEATGKICTGNGFNGRQNLAASGRGGDLLIFVANDPETSQLPALEVQSGGVLCTGPGGDGEDALARACGLASPASPVIYGGDGSRAGVLQLFYDADTSPNVFPASILLGKGGSGGTAVLIAPSGEASGGNAGFSMAFVQGSLPTSATSSWFALSQGGNGGDAVAVPCHVVRINCDEGNNSLCLQCTEPVCSFLAACVFGANVVEDCKTFGDAGTPDPETCPEPGFGTTANGQPGGFGVLQGGKGGEAVAEGCPNPQAGEPGFNQGKSPCSHSPCTRPEPVRGWNGNPGGQGGAATALGGKGGASLLLGGDGGNAKATGGTGGPGGMGGRGSEAPDGSCGDGGAGGQGGAGGRGGNAHATGGDGGTGGPSGKGGLGGEAAAASPFGAPPGSGGPGGAASYWYVGPFGVLAPCEPFYHPAPGAPGAAGNIGQPGSATMTPGNPG